MDADVLYKELRPEIGAVANALFDMSEKILRDLGNFLPHGAVLTRDGRIQMVAADPGCDSDGCTTSTEVLPLLHQGLRYQVQQQSAQAVGVAENVSVTPEHGEPTKAIKVLFEHERGLAVALYLPFAADSEGSYAFGQVFSVMAEPEIRAWQISAA